MDTGEPFGLPQGTVRGMIALAFTAVFLYLGVVGTITSETLLALGGPAIGYYFATRQAISIQKAAVVEAPLEAPATGDSQEN